MFQKKIGMQLKNNIDKLNDLSLFADKILINYNAFISLYDNENQLKAINLLNSTRFLKATYTKNYYIIKKLINKGNALTEEIIRKIELKKNKIIHIEKEVKYRIANLKNKNNHIAYEDTFILNNLPLDWDNRKDLIIILGENNSNLLSMLQLYKQKRVWVLTKAAKQLQNDSLVITDDIDKINLDDFYQIPPDKIVLWNFQKDKNYERKIKNRINFLNASFKANKINIKNFVDLWLINGINNLNHLGQRQNISLLYNQFKHEDCIFIGAGPSLDKNIEYLKKFKKKYYICACLHSLNTLKENDIYPDFVIHADPVNALWVKKLIKNYDFSKVKFLLLSATVDNSLYYLNAQNIMWFNSNNYYDKWICNLLSSINILNYPIAISIIATQLMEKFGFDKLVFMGLDLATTNNKSYSKHIEPISDKLLSEYVKDYIRPKDIEIMGFFEKKIKTNSSFIRQLRCLEEVIKIIKKKGSKINIFNSTEGGAYIKGSNHIPLLEFLKSDDKNKAKIFNQNLLRYNKNNIKTENTILEIKKYKNIFIKNIKNLYNDINQNISKLELLNHSISKVCMEYNIMNLLFQDVYDNLENGYTFYSEDLNKQKLLSFYTEFNSRLKLLINNIVET